MNFIAGDVSHDYSEHIPPERSDTKIQSDTLTGENIPAEDNIVATVCTQSGLSDGALEVRGGRKLRTGEKVEVGQGQEETHRRQEVFRFH